MIALALGLGVLGFFALRRARRRCYAGGYHGYGWHGPWASEGGDGDDYYDDRGDRGDRSDRGGPPWMRPGSRWHARRGRGGRGRRWILHRALSRIDATPAQERVIVGEIDKLQERVRTARGGLKEVRTDLSAAVRGSVLDDAALGAVLGRVDGATAEVRAAAIEALRNIHGVLDDKQRAELAEMLEQGRGGSWRTGPYR